MIGRVILDGWPGFVVLLLAVFGVAAVGWFVWSILAECCTWVWRRCRRGGRSQGCRGGRYWKLPDMPGDPPPMPPMRVRGPLKPGEEIVIPAGMNYATSAKAMKAETVSLADIVAVWKVPAGALTLKVVITTNEGAEILKAAVPPKPKVPRATSFSRVAFYEVSVREYADEGMARCAAIVAEADGFEVMLFLPGPETATMRDDGGGKERSE